MTSPLIQHHTLRTDELDYPLPESAIATRPAEPRDSARMMVVHRGDDRVEHRLVRDLPLFLTPDDLMVFNVTSVVPARLIGVRHGSGGRVEGLYLGSLGERDWNVMLRGRFKPGLQIDLLNPHGQVGGDWLTLVQQLADGSWRVQVSSGEPAPIVLNREGRTPLPPYILKARGDQELSDEQDRAWYQTVYADPQQSGSIAAPTAGLHFTPQLLQRLDASGVTRREVILHVGAGTFRPISTPTLADHVMHHEQWEVPGATLAALRERREQSRGRLIAIGTTTVRALESLPQLLPARGPLRGSTSLLIAPPYQFRFVDGLLTNFHLPRSTLLALVAALIGLDRLKSLYALAVREGYRFYSYGDAMLILP